MGSEIHGRFINVIRERLTTLYHSEPERWKTSDRRSLIFIVKFANTAFCFPETVCNFYIVYSHLNSNYNWPNVYFDREKTCLFPTLMSRVRKRKQSEGKIERWNGQRKLEPRESFFHYCWLCSYSAQKSLLWIHFPFPIGSMTELLVDVKVKYICKKYKAKRKS